MKEHFDNGIEFLDHMMQSLGAEAWDVGDDEDKILEAIHKTFDRYTVHLKDPGPEGGDVERVLVFHQQTYKVRYFVDSWSDIDLDTEFTIWPVTEKKVTISIWE